jgi:protein tyrosine/serine phosphatase
VEGLVNARDLGGLRRVDGTTTPRGVFYRSENVDGVTPAGWEQIYQTGIRTIVDLRESSERAIDRNGRPSWIRTETVELNGFANDEFWRDYLPNGLARTALYFLPHLEAMPKRAVSALSAIVSAPPGGVLFHCERGRDRTGIISLLLLSAVNTDPEEIVDDYLETVRLGDVRAAWSYENNEEAALEAICQSLGTSTENAFRAALAAVDLRGVLSAANVSPVVEEALMSWRGSIQPRY